MEHIVLILCGIILILFGIVGIVVFYNTKKSCDEMVSAQYISYNISKGRGGTKYEMTFEYEYRGKKYKGMPSMACYSQKDFSKYKVGEVYPIYINSKKPNRFVVEKHFTGTDAKLGAWCLFFAAFGIVMIVSAL